MSNIVKLTIKNFLSIADAEIKPGKVNQVVGKNNQGKTTVLKAIEFAIAGNTDPALVKFGEDSAEVIIELADGATIRRRINAAGKQTVEVKKDGFKSQAPQAYLEELFAASAFNPLQLLDSKGRAEAILKSVDIKVTAQQLADELGVTLDKLPPLDCDQHGLKVIDQCYKYFYSRRAEANKDAKDKQKRYETYKADLPSEPDGELGARAETLAAIEQNKKWQGDIEKQLAVLDVKYAELTKATARVSAYESELDNIDKQIVIKQNELDELARRRDRGTNIIIEARKEVPTDLPDKTMLEKELAGCYNRLSDLSTQIAKHDAKDAVSKQHLMVNDLFAEYEKSQSFATTLDKHVELLGGEIKKKVMATAEMPVEGLEYENGEFKINGVPVDNLSSSHALKLAIGVARKLAKKTKLICIDGAELLDTDNYKTLREEIQSDDYTYFLTKVDEPFNEPKDTVIRMENGAVI